ncbi:MAG: hypothetical protein AB8H79_04840 [Myxococcota bacterium]
MWWFLTPPERRVVRPSQTLRAIQTQLRRKVQIPAKPPAVANVHAPPEAPPTEDRVLIHTVDLNNSWSASMGSMDDWFVRTLPESYWPYRDEVDWPANPSVDALQVLMDEEVEYTLRTEVSFGGETSPKLLKADQLVAEALDMAQEEGLLSDTPIWDRPPAVDADPWALLHQAQVHRAAELYAYMHADEDGLRPGQEDEGYGLPEAAWLARQIAEKHPEHPAADFARLMVLETSQWELSSDTSDPQRAVDAVVSAITQTDDPMVKESALIGLLAVDVEDLEGTESKALLAVLDEELHTLPSQVQDAVASQALEIAIRTAPDAIDDWLERLEAASDRDDPFTPTETFDQIWDDLSARGLREANNWSSELHAQVWTCHREHPLPPRRQVAVDAVWEEGWTFSEPQTTGFGSDPADLPPAFWGCIEDYAWRHTPPGANLTLQIFNLPFPTE